MDEVATVDNQVPTMKRVVQTSEEKAKQKVADMWEKICEKRTGSAKRAINNIIKGRFSDLPSLTLLDDAFLKQEGVNDEAERDAVVRHVQLHLQEEDFAGLHPPKLINDPIYGTISLHPLAVLIMNTPQFQRLHYIKQLSLQYYVYPSAGYSRFEHSVGVYHLAGKLVKMLKDRQPELKITAIDVMCVQLAGLCHDLGHGPFSHLFDGTVIPELKSKIKNEEKWKHEVASVALLNDICCPKLSDSSSGQTSDEVLPKIAEWGVCKEDIEFIKSLITGKIDDKKTGQRANKSYLYEIVSNELSGMDVDKWDYLVRDSYHLGIKCGFDPDRLMYHMRVMEIEKDQTAKGGKEGQTVEGDGKEHICVRRKEHDSVYSMFHTRYELYRKAYQHPVVNGVELMVAEAIVEAGKYRKDDTHLKIDGTDGQSKTLMECTDDMVAYTNLHDGIFFKILENKEGTWNNSKKLLVRIQERDLWKCVGQAVIPSSSSEERDKSDKVSATTATAETTSTTPPTTTTTATSATTTPATTTITNTTTPVTKEHLCHTIAARIGEALGQKPDTIAGSTRQALKRKQSSPDLEFKCKVNTRNFGKKDKNPLEKIGFYDKEDPKTASLIKDEDARSAILPKEFQQSILFVYCTSEREKLKKREKEISETVKKVFDEQRLKALSS